MVRDFVVCFRIRLIVFLMILDIENEDEPIHLDLGAIDYTRRLTELQRRNIYVQPMHWKQWIKIQMISRRVSYVKVELQLKIKKLAQR